jgi:hypothetical protein
MRGHFQKIFWLSLDHLMPDGSPVFLMIVILLLLVVNGALLAARLFSVWRSSHHSSAPFRHYRLAERRQAMNLWAGSHKSHEDRAIILLSDRGSRPDCLA